VRKLDPAQRERLAADPFMSRCCITGRADEKIDWHHNLIFAGRQVNEDWAILPLIRSIHDRAFSPEIKDRCDWVMLNRATDEQLTPYCKAIDLIRRREILNQRYGDPRRSNRELDLRVSDASRGFLLAPEHRTCL
jgi:hypothetical protein